MTIQRFFVGRAVGVLVILAVLGVAWAVSELSVDMRKERVVKTTTDSFEPYRATLSGEYLCLPPPGSGEEECRFGLKTTDGTYYAIDFSLMSQTPPQIGLGQHLTASGIVTPVERLSSEYWQKQRVVKGIFSVTDSVEIN